MAKKKGCLFKIGIALLIFIGMIFVLFCMVLIMPSEEYETVNYDIPNMRDYYTHIKGNGEDKVTLMVYMVGSDLESDGGAASEDIAEMAAANADNINITLQTGGAAEWENASISDGKTERHIIKNGELQNVENLGETQMTSPNTLTDFIKWSAANYPADRYELVLWNHGGGTALGFGYDEMYPDDMLSLSQIGNALSDSGIKFDIVGFDACLMGTIETAYMLEPYADYLVASEEYEPGTGWYYSEWLKNLSDNTSMPTVEIGKKIVEDYINGPDSSFFDSNTLSIVDLREIPYTYSKLCETMQQEEGVLDSRYSVISQARYNAKSFGDGEYEQIDIKSYLEECGKSDTELGKVLRSAVKYSGSSSYNSNGLAMYFPYDYPDYYAEIKTETDKFGYNGYNSFFDRFLSIMGTGQMNYSSENDYSDYSWYDNTNYDTYNVSDELEVKDKGDYFALSLSDEEWDKINGINVWVYVDDGDGYVDLGSDNVYEFDDDGDLMVDFDYYWVALNGQVVPFYFEYETPENVKDGYTYGYVPAVLNGNEQIEIMIYWDEKHPDGYLAGYRPYSEEENISVPQKGFKQLKNGDTLEFLCDYYTYDGEYDGVYSYGDKIVVNGDITVGYEYVGEYDTNICYELTDIYNNSITTEMIELKMN